MQFHTMRLLDAPKARGRFKALIALAAGATALAWFAVADQEDPGQSGPLGLIIQYKCLPQHRVQFRQRLEQNLVSFAQGQSDGMLAEYHILFSRYVDTNAWDALALLRFRQYTDVARWRRIEEHSPAGLDPSALALTETIETYPADLMRQAVSEDHAPHPVYVVVPYTHSAAAPQYLKYVDEYIAPQFAGWMQEGVLSGYQIYLQRYIAARPWDSMIFLRYKNDEGLGQRENVAAKVRAQLQDNPVWKAASEGEQNPRSEKEAVIADELVR